MWCCSGHDLWIEYALHGDLHSIKMGLTNSQLHYEIVYVPLYKYIP